MVMPTETVIGGPADIQYILDHFYFGGPAIVPSCPYPEVSHDAGEIDTVDIIASGVTVGIGQSFAIPILISNDEKLINIDLNLYFDYSGGSSFTLI